MSNHILGQLRQHLHSLLKEMPLWCLIGLGILYFYRPLFLDEAFFFRDLHLHDLPEKELLADYVRAGELPLWDPYHNGGRPYLANIVFFTCYPLNLAYVFWPVLTAFNLMIVGHCLACTVCAYACARVLKFQPLSSCITGAVYGFCGYVLSLTNILNRILAMPYIPLLLLFWHLWLLERKKRWFLFAVLAGVSQVLAGAPETNILTLGLVLGWSLAYPYPHRKLWRRVVWWGVLNCCILGVSAAQIVPMLEVLSQSRRGAGLVFSSFAAWSLSPKRLPELVVPDFLGYPELAPPDVYYWGQVLEHKGFPYIISIYVGAVTLMLAIAGMFGSGTSSAISHLPRRVRGFSGVVIGLALILTLGQYWPFFHGLYRALPLITIFRYPIKFLAIGIFPLALLAGYGSELHFGLAEHVPSRKVLGLLWAGTFVFGGITLLLALSDTAAGALLEFFFAQPHHAVARQTLTRSMGHLLLMWFGVTLVYQYRHLKPYAWQHAVLAGMIAVDLFVAGQHVNFYAPAELFSFIPPVVPLIKHELGEGRLYRTDAPDEVDLVVPMIGSEPDPRVTGWWRAYWNLEILNSYLAVFYRIPTIYHDDIPQFSPTRILELKTFLASQPWEQRLPFLSAGAVTLVLSSDVVDLPELPKIADIPNHSPVPLYLYRNLSAANRVTFSADWIRVDSDPEALEAMLRSGYDPRREVVIHPPARMIFEPGLADSAPERAGSESLCAADAQIVAGASASDFAEYSVSNACAGYLVFSEIFYPGWRVFVDGERVPIARANVIFSASYLEPGTHEIRREYRPHSVRLGLWCSGVSLIGLGIFAGWRGKNGGPALAERR